MKIAFNIIFCIFGFIQIQVDACDLKVNQHKLNEYLVQGSHYLTSESLDNSLNTTFNFEEDSPYDDDDDDDDFILLKKKSSISLDHYFVTKNNVFSTFYNHLSSKKYFAERISHLPLFNFISLRVLRL